MSETKIYIDTSTTLHVGIIIYKDGVTTRIDGNQSAGLGTPQGAVPVDDPGGSFGNVIIEIGQVVGEIVPAGAHQLNLSPSEIDDIAQSMLNAVIPQNPPSNMTKFGPLQSGFDDPDFLAPAVYRSWIDLETGYNPTGHNSNTVANTILAQGGLDFDETLESVGINPHWYGGKNSAFDSNGDDTIILGNDGVSGGYRVLQDKGGNDVVRIQNGSTAIITNDHDPSSSNTVILEGYDKDDVELVRTGNDLEIRDKNTGKTILHLFDHFDEAGAGVTQIGFAEDEDGNGGEGDLIQFDPATGEPTSTGDEVVPSTLQQIADWVDYAWDAFMAAWNSGSPLVLDLDGDGIELVSLVNSNVYWDIDQDGFAEAIGWVQADDGFLAIDANLDGIITDHSELFGSVAEDGFTDLRLLDSNSDNVINASDTAFGQLLVWRDLNQNGFSEANELFSLSALNIVSINANATAVNQTNAGHDVSHVSTYTVDDGVSGPQNLAIVDVWFQYDDINSEFVDDYTLDLASLFTVNQRGYGTLPDLYVAASIDNDWTDPDSLLSLLTAFSGKTLDELLVDDGSVLADVEAIMLRWAGVDGVDPASRGHNVDARKLEFLEELFGQEFLQAGWLENPGGFAGDMLDKAFDIALDALTARLIAQGAGQALFTGGTFYNPVTDTLDGVTGLNLDTLDAVLAMAQDASKVSDKVAFWKGVVNVIDQLAGVGNLSNGDQTALNAAIAASDSTLSTALILESLEWLSEVGGSYIGTSGNDTLSGTVGNDTFAGGHGADALSGGIGNDFLNGQSGDDILNGQSGDDELLGDSGSDTYLYFAGQGHDIFRENGSGTDRILFGPGITFADLTFTRISNSDLLIEVSEAAGGGAITIEQQFRSSDAGYIELLEFADSSTVSLNSLVHTLHGTNGADTLKGIRFGGSQNDTIYAYDGDDVIYGHSGTQDTGDNVIHAGDGNDQVFGGNGVDWIEGGNGNDLLKGNNGADTIDGGDGDDEIHGGSQADLLMGGAGADKLYADNDNDILMGGLGADELTGGTGADTFRFLDGQTFDAVDIIKDFNTTHGDIIDIQDILEGYDPNTHDITDFVQITTSGSNSLLAVDADGGGDNFIQIAVILNKTGLTDEDALLASGRLLAA